MEQTTKPTDKTYGKQQTDKNTYYEKQQTDKNTNGKTQQKRDGPGSHVPRAQNDNTHIQHAHTTRTKRQDTITKQTYSPAHWGGVLGRHDTTLQVRTMRMPKAPREPRARLANLAPREQHLASQCECLRA